MYTKKDLGRELAVEINKNFDVVRIARWAHERYLDHARDLDRETDDAIMTLIVMEEGEQFEKTKEELLTLAADLQKDT